MVNMINTKIIQQKATKWNPCERMSMSSHTDSAYRKNTNTMEATPTRFIQRCAPHGSVRLVIYASLPPTVTNMGAKREAKG